MIHRAILKFELIVKSGEQPIRMPPGAVIRRVADQEGHPGSVFLWAECAFDGEIWDADTMPAIERRFHVVATGQHFPEGTSYIGTTDYPDPWNRRALVFHVVEAVA